MSPIKSTSSIDTSNDLEDALSDTEVSQFKKKTLSGAMVFTLRSLFLFALTTVTQLLLAAKLTAVDFGTFGLVTQIIILLQFFTDVGFGPTLIQMKREPTLKQYQSVFTLQQLLTWVIFILVMIIGFIPAISQRIGNEGQLLLFVLGIAVPLGSLKTISAIKLERELAFSKFVIPHIVEQIVYSVILITLILKGWGLNAYSAAIMVRTIAGVITMLAVKPWPMGFAFDIETYKQVVTVGFRFQASDLLARIKDNLSSLVIASFLPDKDFGYVTFAKQFSQLPYNLTVQNVISITFPAFAWLQNDSKRLNRAIEKTLFFISLTIFPMLVGMVIFVYPLTLLIPDYAKWQPAIPVFIMMTISIGWGAISTPLTNTLNAIGKINETLKLMVLWTSLTWILMPILTWWLGYTGVGIATLIIAFSSIFTIILVKKYVVIDVWAQVWRQLVAAMIMFFVGWIGREYWSQSFVWFFVGGLLTVLTYVGSLLLLGYSELKKEILTIKSF